MHESLKTGIAGNNRDQAEQPFIGEGMAWKCLVDRKLGVWTCS